MLIRPTVLPTPEVAALAARSEKDRMPGVRGAEIEFNQDELNLIKRQQLEELKNSPHPADHQ